MYNVEFSCHLVRMEYEDESIHHSDNILCVCCTAHRVISRSASMDVKFPRVLHMNVSVDKFEALLSTVE